MSDQIVNPSSTTPVPTTPEPWLLDANYFKGMTEGWAFAAAVACSVQPDLGRGNRNERSDSGKVSASTFARAAGTSSPRVMRYFRIWAAAAEKGYVQPADTLKPGTAESITLPTDIAWRDMAAIEAAEKVTDDAKQAKKVWRTRFTKWDLKYALAEARKRKNGMLKNPDFTEDERQSLIAYANDLIALGNLTLKQAQKAKVVAQPQKPNLAAAAKNVPPATASNKAA